jgi:hypothetical protein
MSMWVKIVALLLLAGVGVVGLQIIASESGEVVVITTRDSSGQPKQTRLWVVDHDGDAWLRAGSAKAGWYQRLRADAAVEVQRGAASFAARAEPVAQIQVVINQLMQEKYGWADAYIGFLFGREAAIPIRLTSFSERS